MIGKQNYWIHFIVLLCGITAKVHAQQAALETFGQNRIQTKQYEWQYYDSTHFRVFYSSYGKFNAQFILQQAEAELTTIVYKMGARQPRKINIVLYNSYSDFKQSNIGKYKEDIILGSGGAIDVSNNSLSIYFDGTHKSMQQQVRRGIVTIIKDNLLYGYTLKEVVKNSVKMNLPIWFTSGYVNYTSEDWGANENTKLKSILSKRPKRKFEDFTIDNPQLVGHSFFNYISQNYDESKVNDVLFVVRTRNNVDKAIEFIFKIKAATFYKQWRNYYYTEKDSILNTNNQDTSRTFFASIATHKGAYLKNFALSPNGTDIAYCEIKDGAYAIYIYNSSSKKSNKIVSSEIRTNLEINDPNYPLICWNKDGRKLAIMYEKDFLQRLKVYDAKKGRISDRIVTNNKFDRLNSMSFMEDDDKLVISAIKKGQSDLYQYVIKNAQLVPITKDIWNDINPVFVSRKAQEGILFMSNRPENKTTVPVNNNELPNLKFDIFFYNSNTGSNQLLKISEGIAVAKSNPIMYGETDFAFLYTDTNNTKQRIIATLKKDKRDRDSLCFYKTIPMPNSILQQAYVPRTNSIMEIVEKNGKYIIYNTAVKKLLTADSTVNPVLFSELQDDVKPNFLTKKTPSIFYMTEFVNDIDSLQLPEKSISLKTNDNIVKKTIRKFRNKQYTTTFSPDFFQTTADNSVLFNKYQNINQQGYGYKTPDLAGLVKLSLIDVMEDHKITAAVRIPKNLRGGTAYMLRYANFKKRLDYSLTFFRTGGNFTADAGAPPPYFSPYKEFLKLTTSNVELGLVWPFNITSSIRANIGMQVDKSIYKISTDYSSRLPNQNSIWNFNRIEYIYDNTAQSMVNIKKGTRLKIYSDAFFQYKDSNAIYALGIDVRNYLPLYKNCILATRVSNAYSFGKARILYSIGGIDNEFKLPNINGGPPKSLNMDASINYQYQISATSLRGYANNIALGSSFGILNEEIRLPIANTLFNRNFRSKFLNEFQLVLFADIASAWTGFSPGGTYVNYFVSPTVEQQYKTYLGYGFGARTKLFGYNVHADLAWNNEPLAPGQIKVPRLHISTTQDF